MSSRYPNYSQELIDKGACEEADRLIPYITQGTHPVIEQTADDLSESY